MSVCMANFFFRFCSTLTFSNEFCLIALASITARLPHLNPPYSALLFLSFFFLFFCSISSLLPFYIIHLAIMFIVCYLLLPSNISSTRESLSVLAHLKCLDQYLTLHRNHHWLNEGLMTHVLVYAYVYLYKWTDKMFGTG